MPPIILLPSHVRHLRAQGKSSPVLMMPGGGYVAGASHDSILEETPVENVLAMFDAIREFGHYKHA